LAATKNYHHEGREWFDRLTTWARRKRCNVLKKKELSELLLKNVHKKQEVGGL
jgi:hypothetical protein